MIINTNFEVAVVEVEGNTFQEFTSVIKGLAEKYPHNKIAFVFSSYDNKKVVIIFEKR